MYNDLTDYERYGDEIEFLEDCCTDPRVMFAKPGSGSALRAAGPGNPRNLPCPTCGEPNRLTPADVARGYQCDECADIAEGGGW